MNLLALNKNPLCDNAFTRLYTYTTVESDLEAALQKAETAWKEKSTASVVVINAKIRQTKARLLEEVPKLQRLAVEKVKGLSGVEPAARNYLVLALPDRTRAIPVYQMEQAAAPKQSEWHWIDTFFCWMRLTPRASALQTFVYRHAAFVLCRSNYGADIIQCPEPEISTLASLSSLRQRDSLEKIDTSGYKEKVPIHFALILSYLEL
ncbi:hypothetical protein ACH5RR_024818 [Cinchona calisaya]|uniref:Uncharacterized protein n=1 Tax=Cinchona calisaya TaxID=153742 RepID=A0ABD2YYP0_9GENT